MPASIEYITRETGSNLWRNRLTTCAAVLTVAISLALVGTALLLRQGASKAVYQWENGVQVAVFMNPNAPANEINTVKLQLAQNPLVQHPCVFRDHQWDYNEAKQLEPQVINESDVTPAQIPESFRCVPTSLTVVPQIEKDFNGMAGVDSVRAPLAYIHTEQEVITVLQLVFLAVSIVLLISAVVLILNTIRMAIFARRREVSVMKLVGATNWFIRVPFMSEGLFQGLLGSAVAAGLVWGLHELLDHFAHSGNLLSYIELSGFDVGVIAVVIVLLGAAVGTLSSFVAIRRFLDV